MGSTLVYPGRLKGEIINAAVSRALRDQQVRYYWTWFKVFVFRYNMYKHS